MHVQTKETLIKMKEDERGNLKATIENEKQEQDVEMSKLRQQLDEQKNLIGKQRKHLNHLQVMSESLSSYMHKEAQELAKKNNEKEKKKMS